jgi:hypothetical protein
MISGELGQLDDRYIRHDRSELGRPGAVIRHEQVHLPDRGAAICVLIGACFAWMAIAATRTVA